MTISANVEALTEDTFGAGVKEGYTLVDFWAAWCAPCRVQGDILNAYADEPDSVKVAKVDIDANPRLAQAYGVQSIPTMILMKDGVEVDRLIGVTPLPALHKRVESVTA